MYRTVVKLGSGLWVEVLGSQEEIGTEDIGRGNAHALGGEVVSGVFWNDRIRNEHIRGSLKVREFRGIMMGFLLRCFSHVIKGHEEGLVRASLRRSLRVECRQDRRGEDQS